MERDMIVDSIPGGISFPINITEGIEVKACSKKSMKPTKM